MKTSRPSIVFMAAAALALTGCADRRIFINSTPPGATVYLNDAEVGQTPCEVNFTYFGVYDVRLHKDGYEPLVTKAKADAPLHEQPGVDLVAMAVPGTKHTKIQWNFTLQPADNDVNALVNRADAMRQTSEAPAAK